MSRPEERAASEVVGAVILFGFLVITFSIYQGVVVPNQNRGIEFDHNQAVQDSIQDLRNAIRQTATTGAEESVSIKLGASYPQRVIAVNPGASAGAIGTEPLTPITIRNISATAPETRDYFGTNTTTLGSFDSKTIVYRPVYFQYTQAPTTRYENTLAYNQFPGGVNLTITDQALINDRQITLVALNGSLSAARQGTVTVDTTALSTATNTVSVTNDTGPINVTFGTRLTAANWTDLLEPEFTPTGHVTEVKQTGPNQVSIILEPGTYDLRLARVGVGTDTTATDAKYIVDAEGDDTSVAEGGTQKLVVEARDRFNNPVSNVTISAPSPSQGSLDTLNGTTDSSGRVTFVYSAPNDVDGAQDIDIDLNFSGDGTANETVTFDVRVLDADGSGGGDGDGSTSDEINPSSDTESLVWVNATSSAGGNRYRSSASQVDDVTVYFENTDGSNQAIIEEVRYQFYAIEGEGGSVDIPKSLRFDGSNAINLVGPFVELNDKPVFAAGETKSVELSFHELKDGGGEFFDPDAGDFFIISIKYTLDGEERQGTYFVGISP